MKQNSVGENIKVSNANWSFGGDVSETFDDHVSKSVPLYFQGHELIAQLSDFYLHDGSICYDLGCSTGTLLKKIIDRNSCKKVTYKGIDSEKGMINKAKQKCKNINDVSFSCTNMLDTEFESSDLIISYYTMQFIHPKNRQIFFNRIYESLNWGGAFVLFEKVRGPDARFQDLMTSMYMEYKLDQGYSPQEIVAKRRSLKGVLEPFSTQGNLDLLKRSGFSDIMSIMKYICFEGFVAIK